MTTIPDYDETAPMDDRGVVHGVKAKAFALSGGKCGYEDLVVADECSTFECPNCERHICYCMGHDGCALCDECCAIDHLTWDPSQTGYEENE
jgi:hypothetical protein